MKNEKKNGLERPLCPRIDRRINVSPLYLLIFLNERDKLNNIAQCALISDMHSKYKKFY